MPDRPRARVLITALLLLLTVAGIRAIGPGGDWGRHAGDILVVGLGLEAVLAGLLIGLRWRRQPAEGLAFRLNRLVTGGLAAIIIAVAGAIILGGYDNSPHNPDKLHPPRFARPRLKLPDRVHRVRFVNPNYGALLRDVLVGLLVAAIITILVIAWWRRRRPAQLGPVPELEVGEARADLARAVESGRAALLELSDARAAIIRCYAAMEQSLANAGAERGAAETPDELLGRAVQADLVPRAPAELLTALFYEARYSAHDMPASQRDAAEQALAEIAAVLPVGDPA
ncbi:MAG TPA: DUF4129 domain-containing protein [Streptosporangiaceae bacterium]|nr:DUF4129 domain-containing protein [Streptosporangiaceae bacterium]